MRYPLGYFYLKITGYVRLGKLGHLEMKIKKSKTLIIILCTYLGIYWKKHFFLIFA